MSKVFQRIMQQAAALAVLAFFASAASAQSTGVWWRTGGNQPVVQTPASGAFALTGSPSHLSLRTGTFPDSSLWVDLAPGVGRTLQVGAFENTAHYPFNGNSPGLDVTIGSFACTGSTPGRFSVLEAVWDGNNIVSLALDFHAPACGDFHGELRINSSIPFSADRAPGWTTPDPMAFAARTFLMPGAAAISAPSAVYGVNAPTAISVTNGQYSVNGGAFTSIPGVVANKDTIRLLGTAPGAAGSTDVVTLNVGGVAVPWTLATYTIGVPITGARFEGAPGDYILGGLTLAGVAPDWTVTATDSSGYLTATIAFGPDSFTLNLAAPPGSELAPGAYEATARAAFRGASPGVDFYGDGRGCNQSSGRFVIHEIAVSGSTVTKLSANFEQSCDGGPRSYGEVRINSAVPFTFQKPANATLPDAMAFGARDPVAPGAQLLSNTTALFGVNAPVPLSITGGKYSVNGAAFTAVPGTANARDHIVVQVTASAVPGATQTASLNAGGRVVDFSVHTYLPGTAITALGYRSTGDYIGAGATAFSVAPPSIITAARNFDSGVSFHLTGVNGDDFTLDLAAAGNATLTVGSYGNATRFPFQGAGSPGLSFSGNGRGCNTVTGSFKVLEAVYDGTGAVQRFAADFHQYCEGVGPPLDGEIRFNSAVPSSFLAAAPRPHKSRVFDTNGDGAADILLGHTDGRQMLWEMAGETVVGSATLLPASLGWKAALVGDFNGDGKSDILWTHDDGRAAVWLMDGTTQVGGAMLLGASTGWVPKLVGDFNGDGKSDIVWTHPDGRSAIWLMNGATQSGGGLLLPAGTGWTPKLLADFDGDGKADILWEHGDGRSAIWMMNGATQSGGRQLFGAGTGWLASFVVDLDGNGKSDILWTHTDGRTATWLMDGITQVGGAVLMTAAAGYTPILVGDIDGDGRGDIVWKNASGTTIYWRMNGTSTLDVGQFLGTATGYAAQRLADFDGDGRADILGVHADGSVRIFTFDGSGFNSTSTLAPGSGWTVTPVHD